MILKVFTYSALLFSGLSKKNFKSVKNRYNLKKLVDIHHIIPREFRYHPTIILSKYEIENGYNLMFLPTIKGSNLLNIHVDRPIHKHGHRNYNKYIETVLDNMFKENKTNEYNLCKLNIKLKQNMRHLNCPW